MIKKPQGVKRNERSEGVDKKKKLKVGGKSNKGAENPKVGRSKKEREK